MTFHGFHVGVRTIRPGDVEQARVLLANSGVRRDCGHSSDKQGSSALQQHSRTSSQTRSASPTRVALTASRGGRRRQPHCGPVIYESNSGLSLFRGIIPLKRSVSAWLNISYKISACFQKPSRQREMDVLVAPTLPGPQPPGLPIVRYKSDMHALTRLPVTVFNGLLFLFVVDFGVGGFFLLPFSLSCQSVSCYCLCSC